jgi:hypothetical protein
MGNIYMVKIETKHLMFSSIQYLLLMRYFFKESGSDFNYFQMVNTVFSVVYNCKKCFFQF